MELEARTTTSAVGIIRALLESFLSHRESRFRTT